MNKLALVPWVFTAVASAITYAVVRLTVGGKPGELFVIGMLSGTMAASIIFGREEDQ